MENRGEFLAGVVLVLGVLTYISRWPLFFGLLTFAVFILGLIALAVLDFRENRIPRRRHAHQPKNRSENSNDFPVNNSVDFPVSNSDEKPVDNPDEKPVNRHYYTDQYGHARFYKEN